MRWMGGGRGRLRYVCLYVNADAATHRRRLWTLSWSCFTVPPAATCCPRSLASSRRSSNLSVSRALSSESRSAVRPTCYYNGVGA